MKLEHVLTPCQKINSKWIKNLNVRPGTIKLLKENLGSTLIDTHPSKILFNPLPREMKKKEEKKNEQMGPNETEAFAKQTINKIKRQHSE